MPLIHGPKSGRPGVAAKPGRFASAAATACRAAWARCRRCANGGGEAGGEGDAGDQPRRAQHGQHATHQADVVDVGRRPAAQAIDPVVAQAEGMHRHRGVDRALEQGAVKGQQAVAGSGGAFRKHHQALAGTKSGQHVPLGVVGRLAAAAFDEYRVVVAAEPADQRPACHIALGDEARRQQGVEDNDINEGNMVTDQQALLDPAQAVPDGFDADAEQRQQVARPGTFQALPQGLAARREQQGDLERAGQHMEPDQQQAQAGEKGGVPHPRRLMGMRYGNVTRIAEGISGGHGRFNSSVTFAA